MSTINIEGLFSPLRVGSITLPNRFVLPAMQRGWCVDGAPEPVLGDYYQRRVEGGAGLIISEAVAVDHPSSTQKPLFARMIDDTLPAWTGCVAKVKEAGGNMLIQLWHEGAIRLEGGDTPWSQHPTLSSSGLAYRDRQNGREATTQEVHEIRDAFIRSAILAQTAGADGVEVHCAHGYLLDQFLWPVTNRRTDGYGGDDMRDRVRLPAEIVQGIRDACGPDFVISVRFSQWKEADFGARVAETPEELEQMVTALRDAGANLLHASTRRFWEPEWPGSDLNLAGWARKLSGLPVITVGYVGVTPGIMDNLEMKPIPDAIESSLEKLVERFEKNEFDLVAVGRSQILDPDWVTKIRNADYDAVRLFVRADMGLPHVKAGQQRTL